jgi:pilus assembly protein CpaB
MRRQTVIALAVAVVLGLLAVYLAERLHRQKRSACGRPPKWAPPRSPYAAVPLDYGIDVTPDKVKFVDYPNVEHSSRRLFRILNQLAPGGIAARRPAPDGHQ